MKLENWTLVKNGEAGNPQAIFGNPAEARRWGDGCLSSPIYRLVTMDLPAPPPRDPAVIAVELADAMLVSAKGMTREEMGELLKKKNILLDEYRNARTVTSPKPPAEAKRGLRVEHNAERVTLLVPLHDGSGHRFLETSVQGSSAASKWASDLIADLRALGISVEGLE